MKKVFKYFGILFLLMVILIITVNFYVLSFSEDNYYYDVEGLDQNNVGLVFGASVVGNSKPSDILKDRLKVTFDAYENGKIQKIIVSGDNSISTYNEPLAMQKYLINLGVKEYDIYPDYAGFDTYDSIYRAKEIFGVDSLVLFTQDFHLKRAMYISKSLGLKTFGVETNLQKYKNQSYNNRREVLARIKAFLDVEILKSKPKFLGEKIEIISNEKIEKIKEQILEK